MQYRQTIMSILGMEIDIFVHIAYGKCFCIPYRKLFVYIIYRQNFHMQYIQKYFRLYLIYKLCLYVMYKIIFLYIVQIQIVYIRYRQNIIVYIPYRQYIVNINHKHCLYIFMCYLNSTHNSIFTLVNSVYIKREQ